MPIRVSALGELAEQLSAADFDLSQQWEQVDRWFERWADKPSLRNNLRHHLLELPTPQAEAMIRRSGETTTHFAWCLRDRADEPFTF